MKNIKRSDDKKVDDLIYKHFFKGEKTLTFVPIKDLIKEYNKKTIFMDH